MTVEEISKILLLPWVQRLLAFALGFLIGLLV